VGHYTSLAFLWTAIETLAQRPGPTAPSAASGTSGPKRSGPVSNPAPTKTTARKSAGASPIVTWAEQGWTPEQREFYHYTSQGTVLMPVEWFMALEQPPTDFWDLLNPFSQQPLLSNAEYLAGFGLLPSSRSSLNP